MNSGPRWCEELKQQCPPEEILLLIRTREEIPEYIRLWLYLPQPVVGWPKPPLPKAGGLSCSGIIGLGERRLDEACNCRRLLKSQLLGDTPLEEGH